MQHGQQNVKKIHAIYVKYNNKASLCIHCCCGKTISITYSVALVIQHRMRMRRIIFCGMPGSTVSFHIVSQTARFLEKYY